MKGSFADDPGLRDRLFDLLEVVFAGLRGHARRIAALGAPWESVSTPFVHFEDGRVVAHVGLIELTLVLLGQAVKVGSVHAVATHPEARRRGHYRRLMEELFEDCAGRYQTLILTTEHPEYFEPFGFRQVREHGFRVRCRSLPGREGWRPIDIDDVSDVTLLRRLLTQREAVSRVMGVVDELAVFFFNECRRPLHYAEDLDAVVSMEVEGTRVRLYDVVAPQVPPLAHLLARIPQRVDEVFVYFAPDRLAVEAQAVPYLFDHDGPSHLMVRGPLTAEGRAFTLPRSART